MCIIQLHIKEILGKMKNKWFVTFLVFYIFPIGFYFSCTSSPNSIENQTPFMGTWQTNNPGGTLIKYVFKDNSFEWYQNNRIIMKGFFEYTDEKLLMHSTHIFINSKWVELQASTIEYSYSFVENELYLTGNTPGSTGQSIWRKVK